MIKRASTILLTLFLLLTSAQVWAVEYTNTLYSTTTFQPIESGSDKYELNYIEITPPFIESIETSFTYNSSDNLSNGISKQYRVDSKGAHFSYKYNDARHNILTVNIVNLVKDKEYTITIYAQATNQLGLKTKIPFTNNEQYPQIGTSSTKIEYKFTAGGTETSFSFSYDWLDKSDSELTFTSIEVSGISEKKISTQCIECCQGEDNTISALGFSGNVKWEYSTDGEATWTPLNFTTPTIKLPMTEAAIYRAINSTGNILTSEPIRTIVCCSKYLTKEEESGLIPVYGEIFDLDGADRRDFEPGTALSEYHYAESGPIGGNQSISKLEAEYAIVRNAKEGGDSKYWNSEPIRTGNTLKDNDPNKRNDGFLLVNCGKEKQDMFYYNVKEGNLCSNSLYDFSVDITNVDNTAGQAPVNAILLVYGIEDVTNQLSSNPLLELPTNNIAPGKDWQTFSKSFNSDKYTKFRICVRNNYQGDETDVKGNDIGIDNIRFRACVPKIQIYSSSEDKYETLILECNKEIRLEAIANYEITEFFEKPYYQFQISSDKVNWRMVGSVQEKPYIDVMVDEEYLKEPDGFYYKVWVGADPGEVAKSAEKQQRGTGCGAITADSEPINVQYSCPCTKTDAPEVNDYTACPVAGQSIDPNAELLVSQDPNLEYVWKDKDDNEITSIDVSNELNETFSVYTKGWTDATTGEEFCPSAASTAIVKIGGISPVSLFVTNSEGTQEIKITEENTTPYEVCLASEVTLKTDVVADAAASEKLVWEKEIAGTKTEISNNQYITETIDEEVTYTLSVQNSTCWTPLSITIKPIETVTPVLDAKTSICLGTPINIDDTTPDTESAAAYQWYVKKPNDTDYSSILGFTSKDLVNYNVVKEGKYSFKSQAINGLCDKFSEPIEITVGAPIKFKISNDTTICANGGAYIKVYDITPTTANTQWYDEDGNIVGDTEKLPSVYVEPDKKTTYTVSLWVEDGCDAEDKVIINVDGEINVEITGDGDICLGDKSQLIASGADSYKWEGSVTLSDLNIPNPIASPIETTTYKVTGTAGKCTDEAEFKVNVHDIPVVESVVIEGEKQNRYAVPTIIGGQAPYSYSLNDEFYSEVPEEILSYVPIGWNLLYVKDLYDCATTKEFYVEPVPITPAKFFSPNQDGQHDEWTIQDLDAYSSYIVEIFDRHGKKLYEKRVGSFNGEKVTTSGSEIFTWDGTYNGHLLPSDDYWYLITVEEIRKQYTGHFTLKR